MAKILLVEDDNNLREIYEARLQAEGYAIVSAKDGEEALVLAKQEHPDLVISDVMMPRVSGFEMLDILRNTEGLRETKIIMLTALGQAEDKTRADSLGADRYLVKSQVTLEDIVKTAQELLSPSGGKAADAGASAPATATPAATPSEPATTPVPAAPATPPTPTPTVPVAAPPADIPEPAAAPEPPAAPTPAPTPSSPTPSPTPEPPQPATPPTPAPAEPPKSEPTEPPKSDDQSTPKPPEPPAPAPPSPPSTPPTEPVATNLTQSTSTEEAAMKERIQDFVQQADKKGELEKPEAIPAPAPQATPPVQPTPPSPTPATDKLVADAVNTLVSSTTTPKPGEIPTASPTDSAKPDTPAPALEPPTATTDNDSVNVAHKKVIKPISDPSASARPDLNELLAREGIEDINNLPHQPTTPLSTPQTPAYQTPHPPGHVISPGGSGGGGVDPNSIAL